MSSGDGIAAGGGGSMGEWAGGCLDGTTGSGNKAIASSPDDVSMVICVVVFGAVRRV